jgi:D-arginine dehydrogenase
MTIDFLVLGAGMAGASAAYFLADHGRVLVLESEEAPGYHTTGRSAALYTETYGNAAIRALTVASGRFFRSPPAGFSEHPLLRPRGVLIVAQPNDAKRFAAEVEAGRRFAPNLRVLDRMEAFGLCPALRADWLGHAFLEPDAMDMDVHAIHQGFLKGLKRKGGSVVTRAPTRSVTKRNGMWEVDTAAGRFTAPILVNATGAWADEVARLAGVPALGLTPKRRTAIIIELPPGSAVDGWPMVCDILETFYFKPESGRLLISPADETPMPPSDVQPDEIDIAVAVARIEAATTLTIGRVVRKWAGLRTFAPDKTLVIGPDPAAEGFVWVAGQGGYGIQTAAAAGHAAAALATASAFPRDLSELGLSPIDLLPDRLRSL